MAKKNNYKKRGGGNQGNPNPTPPVPEGTKPDNPIGEEGPQKPTANNPEWLNHNPELINATANLVFNSRLGKPEMFRVDKIPAIGEDWESEPGWNQFPAPGTSVASSEIPNPSFMVYYYMPTVGVSNDSSSPISLAASQMAAYVRTKISGSRSYDPNDLLMHILTLSSIYDAINVGIRAYGMARYFSAWDLTTPERYLAAMGFDPEDVLRNMMKFNNYINTLILKIAPYSLPGSIKLLLRHAALNSQIFTDGEDVERNQKYFFVPVHFHKFAYPDEDHAYPRLVPVEWVSIDPIAAADTYNTIDEWYDMVNGMIEQVLNNSDFWTIDGDLRKAYEGDILALNTIPTNYILEPTYDAAMSSQMENCTIPNIIPLSHGSYTEYIINNEISQVLTRSSHYLKAQPGFTMIYEPGLRPVDAAGASDINIGLSNCFLGQNSIMNFHWKDVTPLNVAYASQLKTHFTVSIEEGTMDEGTGANGTVHINLDAVSCGTEIIVSGLICAGNSLNVFNPISTAMNVEVQAGQIDNYVTQITAFDWHPPVFLVNNMANANGRLGFSNLLADLDNWAVIDNRTLSAIHTANILSIFNVPSRY